MIIIKSEQCSLAQGVHHYKDDWNHSKYLKEVFGTFNYQGPDYDNPNGAKIEFKESFQNIPKSKIRFATYLKDKLDPDYIVFIYYTDVPHCFVHKPKQILQKYLYNNKKQIAQPYLSTVSKNYIYKTNNLQELKDFLDILKR